MKDLQNLQSEIFKWRKFKQDQEDQRINSEQESIRREFVAMNRKDEKDQKISSRKSPSKRKVKSDAMSFAVQDGVRDSQQATQLPMI